MAKTARLATQQIREVGEFIFFRRYAKRCGEHACEASHDNITRCPVCKAGV